MAGEEKRVAPVGPAVSVVIPCFNAKQYLNETLESVFRQTFRDFEVILVDDGSTDGTADLVRSFEPRARVECGPNRGASAARNRGTELSRGDYVQYLDADDLLRPDAIELRVAALKSSGADVAYSDWQYLVEADDGRFQSGETVARRIEDIDPNPEIAIFTDFSAPPAAILYRRSIVRKIGSWSATLPVIQDARFLLDAALNGARFVHVAGVGADYRVPRKATLSRRDPIAFALDVHRNAVEVEEIWLSRGGLTDAQRAAVARAQAFPARVFFEHARPEFHDAMTRIRSVDPAFRFRYPQVADVLSRVAGRRLARALMRLLVRIRLLLAPAPK